MSANQLLVVPSALEEEENFICQMQTIPQTALPPGISIKFQYLSGRTIRFMKRRKNYVMNFSRELIQGFPQKQAIAAPKIIEHLNPGDFVLVKSREEIQATLNRWNRLDGCGFMEEMWSFCGETHRVRKRVEQFLDERDYRVKRCKNIIILENVHCNGTIDFGRCDRNCFFFWREEWLGKIESGVADEVR